MHPASLRRRGGEQPQQTAAVRQTRKLPRPEARRLAATPLASSFHCCLEKVVSRCCNPNNYFVFYKFLILLLSADRSDGGGQVAARCAGRGHLRACAAAACWARLGEHPVPDAWCGVRACV
jgi:hypothetical protein